MSEMKYFRHKDIDKIRWDQAIQRAQNNSIYAYSWYLDVICDGNWDAVILGDYEAVFPLPWRRKWGILYIYQPFFCQQLGVFGNLPQNLNQDQFINKIPGKFKRIHLQLNAWYPLLDFLKKRNNYLLDLNSPYEKLRSDFKQDALKNLKKTERINIKFSEVISAEMVLPLHQNTWGEQNSLVKKSDYKRFLNLCAVANQQGRLLTISAELEGEILGAAIFMKSEKYLHYLVSGPSAAGRKLSIMHANMNYAIQKYAGTNTILDFEGSEIPDVAVFYEKWGAEKSSYYLYKKNRLF